MTAVHQPGPMDIALEAEAQMMPTRPASLRRDTVRNVLRQRTAVIGLTILGFLVLVALLADFIAPFPPNTSMLDLDLGGTRGAPPCIHLLGCPADQTQHLMGLDSNLRDTFSRVVYGSRVSLLIGVVTVTVAIIIGTLIGAVAGYLSGTSDNILMRLMDVVLSFPSLILAIAIVTVLGTGLYNAMMAIAIVSIPVYARVMRASVLSVRETDFVTASRALGESSRGHPDASHPAQRADAAHRAGHARHRRGDPRGRGALVPRPRRPAADGRVGLDDRPRPQPVLQRHRT